MKTTLPLISQVNVDSVSRLRIIVLGYIVRGPLGGMVWSTMQYLIGLFCLGHDVYFVEDSDDYPSCYDPARGITDTDPTYGLQFAKHTLEQVGLGDRWAYYDAHTSRWLGPCADRILGICATADLVLNFCGVNPLRPWLMQIPARALIDGDPAFTQIRHLTEPATRDRALQHTAFLSLASNINLPQSLIPNDGLPWQPTTLPIVLDAWPVTPAPLQGKFTTVMQWESYSVQEYQGVRYGMKSDSFAPYIDLPKRVGGIFELAVSGASTPSALLESNGWVLREPPTQTPWTYQQYIQQSKAEFSVAKHGFVVSRSGFFSDRSVCYLASGRPVLIQETGLSDWLPIGEGILTFRNLSEAVNGIEAINADYKRHQQAARSLAEEYFDSNKVLSSLLETAMS